MISTKQMTSAPHQDPELVRASLAGNREAFGLIVARYQALICSLAYSATGSLTASEDLAQETFVTAWKQLADLREPEKLRAWLCGIARNLIHNSLRRENRDPNHQAGPLEAVPETPAPGLLPGEQAISNEEQAILWRSLARVPELYREPLVLFYREHQSIQTVALNLDLSEATVKQRLSRGRKLLQEQVVAFVEGALVRTSPGQAFTLGVLAALPVSLTTSAKAATLGATAAKGGLAAKAAASAGLFSVLIMPLLGLVSAFIQYRLGMAAAISEEERKFTRRFSLKIVSVVGLFVLGLCLLSANANRWMSARPGWYAAALLTVGTAYVVAIFYITFQARDRFAHFRAEQQARDNPVATNADPGEYRSPWNLLGLPLVHFRWNCTGTKRPPVRAWIAYGDYAFGLIFAAGAVAVAPVCVGGLSIGLLSFGGLAVGGFPAGGVALGGWAVGGFALGWQAFGGCAFGWQAAQGGVAYAHDFAYGETAIQATTLNVSASGHFFENSQFFRTMRMLTHHLIWLNVFWVLPVWSWCRTLQRLKRRTKQS